MEVQQKQGYGRVVSRERAVLDHLVGRFEGDADNKGNLT